MKFQNLIKRKVKSVSQLPANQVSQLPPAAVTNPIPLNLRGVLRSAPARNPGAPLWSIFGRKK